MAGGDRPNIWTSAEMCGQPQVISGTKQNRNMGPFSVKHLADSYTNRLKLIKKTDLDYRYRLQDIIQ